MFEEKNEEQKAGKDRDEQDLDNLAAFFDLLMKIDMRNNPQLYKNPQNYD